MGVGHSVKAWGESAEAASGRVGVMEGLSGADRPLPTRRCGGSVCSGEGGAYSFFTPCMPATAFPVSLY